MAQAFGVPAFPVDTHIHRLAWRWGLSAGTNVERTERDLMRTFAREKWNKLHLQLIHFGRNFCPARQHVPAACPICSWAMSRKRRIEEERQRRQPKALGSRNGTQRSKRRRARSAQTMGSHW